MVKDLKTVEQFKNNERMKFYRGMCFNNAAVVVANSYVEGANQQIIVDRIYEIAEKLFKEGIRQKFNQWGENGS